MDHVSVKEKISEFSLQYKNRTIKVGVGCAYIGSGSDYRNNLKNDLELLTKSYEIGFKYYDTSRSYGNSEQVLGEFVKTIDRKSIFLATKSRFPFDKNDSFEYFKRNFYESFERLHTDHIDLFQIHDTENFRVCEEKVIPFLEDRKKDGLIDYIGLGMRSQIAHLQGIYSGHIDTTLSYMDYNLVKLSAVNTINAAKQKQTAFINASVLLFGLYKNNKSKVKPAYGYELRFYEFVDKMIALCARMNVDIFAASYQYSLLNPSIDMTLFGMKSMDNIISIIKCIDFQIYPEQWAEIFKLQEQCEYIYTENEN